jgi:CheY-like chemotaxis protein
VRMDIIIITADPEQFKTVSARVYDNANDVFAALKETDCNTIYADFRQLKDGWTGLKFLREIRAKPQYKDIQFYIMIESSQSLQDDWIMKHGATGVVGRSPKALGIANKNVSSPSTEQKPVKNNESSDLTKIDNIFRSIAGPFSDLHIDKVRQTLSNSPSLEGYTAALADCLALAERRELFLSLVDKSIK